MLDENKVRLMTRLSIFEKKEKNNGLPMSRFFERDYVRFNVLKTLVAATIVYWTIVGAYVFISFEVILAQINNMDYFGVMYRILGWYVAFCFVYFVFAYLVYSYRYNSKRKGLARYNSDLKDLIELSGGPMHRGKLVKNSSIKTVNDNEVTKNETSGDRSKNVVNRTEMVKNRLKMEEEERNRQIIENSKRLEEQRAKKRALEEQKKREAEEERLKIRQRRMALEEEQRQRECRNMLNLTGKGITDNVRFYTGKRCN